MSKAMADGRLHRLHSSCTLCGAPCRPWRLCPCRWDHRCCMGRTASALIGWSAGSQSGGEPSSNISSTSPIDIKMLLHFIHWHRHVRSEPESAHSAAGVEGLQPFRRQQPAAFT